MKRSKNSVKRYTTPRSVPPLERRQPPISAPRPEPTAMDKDALASAVAQAIRDTQDTPRPTQWQRRANWLRGHPVVVIMEAIGLVSLIFAVGLFAYELRERQDERTARSWQLLTTAAQGNSGKKEALEHLNSEYGCIRFNEPVWYVWLNSFVDDTLHAPELGWFGWEGGYTVRHLIDVCWKEKTPLSGVNISQALHGGPVLMHAVSLRDVTLVDANLTGAQLPEAQFENAYIIGTNFEGADLSGANMTDVLGYDAKFANAELFNVNFTSASLGGADFTNASIPGVELSGASITFLSTSSARSLSDVARYAGEAWFWSDTPVDYGVEYPDYIHFPDDILRLEHRMYFEGFAGENRTAFEDHWEQYLRWTIPQSLRRPPDEFLIWPPSTENY